MADDARPDCKYCGKPMLKWKLPDNTTWTAEFFWVCFNDDCSYFVKGWDHMMSRNSVKASYRNYLDPTNNCAGPLPVWSIDALKDRIIKEEE